MPHRRHARPAAVSGIGGRARSIVAVALSIGLVLVGVGVSDAGPQSWGRADPVTQPRGGEQPVGVSREAGAGRSTRASGLPWASGVFSHDSSRTVEFDKTRGRASDVLAVFPTRDSWDAVLEDWWMSPSAVPEGFTGTLAVGVPLFPDGGSMEAVARGEDDAKWTELGRLIASKYPDAWVRPGWEMNIPNWPWAATPENVETYKQAFRHASQALKKGGPQLRVVFNPNEGKGASLPDARMAYPGDDVVDTVGIDAYDWDPGYAGGGWEEHRTKDQGWDFWMQFARDRGKTFALPEWGVITGNENSGGDNPAYIEAVVGWMAQHADTMAFDAYFEEPADYCKCALSLNPRAQQAYTQALAKIKDAPATARSGDTATPRAADRPGETGTTQPGATGTTGDATPTASDATDAGPTAAPESADAATDSASSLAPGRAPGRGRYGRPEGERTLPAASPEQGSPDAAPDAAVPEEADPPATPSVAPPRQQPTDAAVTVEPGATSPPVAQAGP